DGEVDRERVRRAICSTVDGCGRSHVLLPRRLLGRRLDDVAVIWSALLARAYGHGWRKAVEAAKRPASTVRGWLSRLAERATVVRHRFADLEHLVADGDDLDRLAGAGSPVRDALAQVGACLAAVRRSLGPAVLGVSAAQMVAVLSGGWLLGRRPFPATTLWINTTPHL